MCPFTEYNKAIIPFSLPMESTIAAQQIALPLIQDFTISETYDEQDTYIVEKHFIPSNSKAENISLVNLSGLILLRSDVFASKLSVWEDYIVAGFLTCIGAFSVFLNLLVVFVCYKNKKKLMSADLYIINLAISDLFLPLFGFPFTVTSSFSHKWIYGVKGCHAYGFIGFFCGVVSMSTLAVMSIVRYISVCHMDIRLRLTECTRWFILCTYGYAVVWAVPPMVGWGAYGVEPHGTSCTINWRGSQSFVTLMLLLCIILPVTVMISCYGSVLLFLRRSRDNMKKWRIPHKGTIRKKEGYLIKMTFTMCFSFVGMWTPYAVVSLWTAYGRAEDIPLRMSVSAVLIAKLSTVVNPLIYCILNKKFKPYVISLVSLTLQNLRQKLIPERSSTNNSNVS